MDDSGVSVAQNRTDTGVYPDPGPSKRVQARSKAVDRFTAPDIDHSKADDTVREEQLSTHITGGLWEQRWDPVVSRYFFRNRVSGVCRWRLQRKSERVLWEEELARARDQRNDVVARLAARVADEMKEDLVSQVESRRRAQRSALQQETAESGSSTSSEQSPTSHSTVNGLEETNAASHGDVEASMPRQSRARVGTTGARYDVGRGDRHAKLEQDHTAMHARNLSWRQDLVVCAKPLPETQSFDQPRRPDSSPGSSLGAVSASSDSPVYATQPQYVSAPTLDDALDDTLDGALAEESALPHDTHLGVLVRPSSAGSFRHGTPQRNALETGHIGDNLSAPFHNPDTDVHRQRAAIALGEGEMLSGEFSADDDFHSDVRGTLSSLDDGDGFASDSSDVESPSHLVSLPTIAE